MTLHAKRLYNAHLLLEELYKKPPGNTYCPLCAACEIIMIEYREEGGTKEGICPHCTYYLIDSHCMFKRFNCQLSETNFDIRVLKSLFHHNCALVYKNFIDGAYDKETLVVRLKLHYRDLLKERNKL